MGEEQGLSATNQAFLERLYEFGSPLPAQFVFTRGSLNDLMDACRSEGLQPPVGVEEEVFSSLGASSAPSCMSAGVAETPSGGWALVPREPTSEMIGAALSALGEWRKTLTPDEALLRRSAPVQNGRQWLASATPEEKAGIRYRAMIAAAPPTDCQTSGGEA